METLARFGTEEQKARWLRPLLQGQIRSCFAMTEPDVASSDATNVSIDIQKDGGDYVINGRKWWCTGAGSLHTKVVQLTPTLTLPSPYPHPALHPYHRPRHRSHPCPIVNLDSGPNPYPNAGAMPA